MPITALFARFLPLLLLPALLTLSVLLGLRRSLDADVEQISFVVPTDDTLSLFLRSVYGGETTLLAESAIPFYDWSHDGGRVAFARELPASELVVLTHEADKPTPPTDDDRVATGYHPVWSPGGSQLALIAGNRANIHLVPADGSAPPQRLLDTATVSAIARAPYNIEDVTWSPDGGRLAFTMSFLNDSGGSPRPTLGVFVVNSDGTGLRAVSNLDVNSSTPVWSPDGSQLAYTAFESSQWWLRIVRLASGDVDGISVDIAPLSYSWSPDGRYLSAAHADNLFLLDRANNTMRQLTYDGSMSAQTIVQWSADGRWLLVGGFRVPDRIRLVDVGREVMMPLRNVPYAQDVAIYPRWRP